MNNNFDIKAILLAAGQGSRMKPLTDSIPKCLLPIDDETLLSRLIKQLQTNGINDITVVTGYKHELVVREITSKFGNNIKIINNKNYLNDVNILSLCCGIQNNLSPFTIFEVDMLIEDVCFEKIVDKNYLDKSVWYTGGYFQTYQVGGILSSDADNKITEICVVNEYADKYKNYKKQTGMLKVGPNEIEVFHNLLQKYCTVSTKQYYQIPWIENLEKLPCYEIDFSPAKIYAFNTPEEYYNSLKLFKNEKN